MSLRISISIEPRAGTAPAALSATVGVPAAGAAAAFAAGAAHEGDATPPRVDVAPQPAEAILEKLPTRLASVSPPELSALKPLPLTQSISMDPRLQLAVANMQIGKSSSLQSSVDAGDIAVIARVESVDRWEELPDVIPGSTSGKLKDGSWIVTGRIPLRRVEAVRGDPNIRSLKASQPLHPALTHTAAAMLARPQDLAAGVDPSGGKGVVIGVVDFGCDFAHRNFLAGDGRTRLEAIWDQGSITTGNPPFGYGRLFEALEIDAALASSDPYMTLGYAPPPDNPFQTGTHGTHVLDIAAGNGNGTHNPGMAPNASLIFVEAAATDVAWSGSEVVNQAFGDSVQLLEAVRFIFDRAQGRPCVVNLSLGTNGGPHDGTSLVEQGLDALVREQSDRAVVIAASNSFADHIHTSGTVPADGQHDIDWNLTGDSGAEFELWYPGKRKLRLSLVAPGGTTFGPVLPGESQPIGSPGQIAIFMSNRADDPNNHDNVLGIWIAPNMAPGLWKVRLESLDGEPSDYHAWIERNDQSQSSFARPVDSHTLGSISTGYETVVVGSYDGHKTGVPLSSFSSAGPTRDGRQKPEVSAPGHSVLAAWSRTKFGATRKSGTSMASPAVTGLVALVLAEARRNGTQLSSADIRKKLQAHAIPAPGGVAGGWHDRYGFGRASGKSI